MPVAFLIPLGRDKTLLPGNTSIGCKNWPYEEGREAPFLSSKPQAGPARNHTTTRRGSALHSGLPADPALGLVFRAQPFFMPKEKSSRGG